MYAYACARAAAMLFGAWLMAAPAWADVWAYVDESGEVHTAPKQLDSRYQLVTAGPSAKPGSAPGEVVNSAPPSAAPAVLTPVAPVPVSVGSSQPAAPWPPRGLGRRTRESHHDWMQRLNAAPAVKVLDPLLREAGRSTGVDPLLLKAVIAVESAYTPTAVSSRGALGLMQIMPDTADHYATSAERQRPAAERMMDPRTNVLTGARMLADLTRRFNRIDHAMAAWNAGEAAVRKSGGLPPIQHTEHHVSQVMELYWALVRHQASSRGAMSLPR